MAHIGVICPEFAGHLLPIGTLASELSQRGHQITVIGKAKCAAITEQLDLPLREISFEGIPRPSEWLLWKSFCLFNAGWLIAMRGGLCQDAEGLLQRLPPILKELKVDGLIVDPILAAAGSVAESLELPFATVWPELPWNQDANIPPWYTHWGYAEGRRARLRNRLGYIQWNWYMQPILKLINRHRRQWKLQPVERLDELYSPLAQISQLCPEIDFPRCAIPPAYHYVGSLQASRPSNKGDFPWEKLDGRPLIYASMGTVTDPMNPPVFRKILGACAGLDAQLVLTLGKWNAEEVSSRETIGQIPENSLVVDFAPQLALLEKASLLITHAGINTVMESLRQGVPMVALPRNADQPGMAARVEFTGAGLCAPALRCSQLQLRGMIERVLSEKSFQQRAAELQHASITAGGAKRAAAIVEQAIITSRPVMQFNHGSDCEFASDIACSTESTV